MRVITPRSPCVEPETIDQWTVGGPSEVVAGAGLTGRSEGGIVTLEVETGLIERANSGRIVAGFDDGPNEIPNRELARIAELPLPAGNYAIFAKLSLRNPFESGYTSVSCRLDAGGDFDRTHTVVEGPNIGSLLENEGTSALTQSLEVVHRFSAPGLLAAAPTSRRSATGRCLQRSEVRSRSRLESLEHLPRRIAGYETPSHERATGPIWADRGGRAGRGHRGCSGSGRSKAGGESRVNRSS